MIAIIIAIVITVLIILVQLDYVNYNNNDKGKIFDSFISSLKKYSPTIIVFLATCVIVFIVLYKLYLKYPNILVISELEQYVRTDIILYDMIVLALFSMTVSLLIDGIFIIPFIQLIYEKIQVLKLEKSYKQESLEYYRELFKNVSPAILSYCYNKKINIEDETVAILLNLQMKNIIRIQNNDIFFINDTSNLSKHEAFVLKNLKSIHTSKAVKKEFFNTLINDMIENKYIYKEDEKKFNITYVIEFFMAWMILYSLITFLLFLYFSKIGILMLITYVMTFLIIPIYKYIQSKINTIIKMENGIDLHVKLKGLKNYIKDFSTIKESGIENINLYDEYVIYAIIFNLKGKLNSECKKLYSKTKRMVIQSIEPQR